MLSLTHEIRGIAVHREVSIHSGAAFSKSQHMIQFSLGAHSDNQQGSLKSQSKDQMLQNIIVPESQDSKILETDQQDQIQHHYTFNMNHQSKASLFQNSAQFSESQKDPAKQDHAIGSMLQNLDLPDHSEQCGLCGHPFEEHAVDYNFEINHKIGELQLLLDKAADVKHKQSAS